MWHKNWGSKLVWLSAIGLRFYGLFTPAQYYDMGTFQAWAATMLRVGPHDFFSSVWSDYLPLPLYTLVPVHLLYTAIAPSDILTFGFLFKAIMSLVELGLLAAAWFNLKGAWRWGVGLLLLSPALIGDTAFWGQLDTLPALLALLSLVLITNPVRPPQVTNPVRHLLAAVLFGLAVAYKPIMLITLPVFIIFLFKDSFRSLLRFSLVSLFCFLATAVPITRSLNPYTDFRFLLSRAVDQAGTYPYTSINAWNLWSIVPHPSSWPPDDALVLGLSAHTFGLVLFTVLAFLLLNHWRRAKFDRRFVFRVAGALLVVFYVVTTRMHERHLLFGLPFLAIASVFEPWLLAPFILLTLGFTLNLWEAYYWVNHAQTWPLDPWVSAVVSWLNVLVAFFLATVWDWPAAWAKLKKLVNAHRLLVAILVLASCLRLVNLGYPPTYIFDEVYHAFTAREFLHNHKEAWEWWTTPPPGVAYEWTHPPLAKYGMVGGMLLWGENSFGWRFGSAVFGVLSILGLYRLVFALFKNERAALLAAFLVAIEGLHLSQSRIAMNDIYMLAFLVWSLYCAVKSRWKLAAVLLGLSLASKWSAVYGLVPLAAIYLHENLSTFHGVRAILGHVFYALRLLAIVAIVYTLTFTPFFLAGHDWSQWWELHRQMWYYHTHLKATHAYQSTPLQWLFSIRPVWYYVFYGNNVTGNIYAQSNPAILWFGLVAFVMLLPRLRKFAYLLLALAYVIFTAPWVASPRIMFFYHYLPSAFFLTAILGVWLSTLPKKLTLFLLVFFTVFFILMSPVYFGISLPKTYWDTLFAFMPSWK